MTPEAPGSTTDGTWCPVRSDPDTISPLTNPAGAPTLCGLTGIAIEKPVPLTLPAAGRSPNGLSGRGRRPELRHVNRWAEHVRGLRRA